MTQKKSEAVDVATEFDVLATRAGLPVPPDRRDALLESYMQLRPMLDLLRQPRDGSTPIAGSFDVRTLKERS